MTLPTRSLSPPLSQAYAQATSSADSCSGASACVDHGNNYLYCKGVLEDLYGDACEHKVRICSSTDRVWFAPPALVEFNSNARQH